MWRALVEQLSYMVDLETGRRFDRDRLSSINVGSVAARLMGAQQHELVSLLASIQAYARQAVLDDNPLR